MTERNEMVAAIEAVLFVSPDPVSRRRLMDLFTDEEQEEAAEALRILEDRHGSTADAMEGSRGIVLEEVGGGLRLVTRPDLNEWLRCFFEAGRSRKLSVGALETLAIVAYRQPVTGPEIQELRSVNPSGVLKTLLERRLVRISGRKEVVGKPFLYGTTQDFLVHFGLRSLKDLPPLEEFEEALAGEGLGELLGGVDLEEMALREAATVEEELDDRQDRAEEAAEGDQAVLQEGAPEDDQNGDVPDGEVEDGEVEDGEVQDGEVQDGDLAQEFAADAPEDDDLGDDEESGESLSEDAPDDEPELDGDEAIAAGVEAESHG